MTNVRRSLLAAAVSILVLVPAMPAQAERSIPFYGSGWGHGVGLSQWGAYGLALQGWGTRQILTHYYSGTQVTGARGRPDKLRIGILQGRSRIHVTAQGGRVGVRIGSVKSWRIGRIASGSTWTIGVHAGQYAIHDAKGSLVGGHLWGSRGTHLFLRYPHAVARVYEAGHSYRRGWLEVGQQRCGCAMLVVAVIAPERYLYGLSEVPSDWPTAALEAQAIAARTYAFERVARLGQHRSGCDCGLWSSTADQVYGGWDKEVSAYGARWDAAVDHTRNLVVTYRGGLIQAYYHSSSGGHTESNENVWGGSPIPYLRGVCDPGDYTPANPNRVWSRRLSRASVGERLGRAGGRRIGAVRRFTDTVRTQAGRILATTAVGQRGSVRVSGDTLASALDLPGEKVWIGVNRNVREPFRSRYDALHCAPGLPETGQINVPGGVLQRFQLGTMYGNVRLQRIVWVYGSIEQAYEGRHGPHGVLGLPVTDVERLRDAPGCSQVSCLRTVFDHGGIYSKPRPGLRVLTGRVYGAFLKHGGAVRLGFPTSGVQVAKDGSQWATFERGVIRCRHGHCHVRRHG